MSVTVVVKRYDSVTNEPISTYIVVGKYVKKGALLGVEGRIQNRSYETSGDRRYITEVVCDSVQFLDTRSEGDSNSYNSPAESSVEDPLFESSKKLNVSEDDLPF